MKYFLDTEFIEGFNKPFLGKRRHFIDLISIGMICEDGRTYYAVSNEFKYRDADKWVQENVIDKIEAEFQKHVFAPPFYSDLRFKDLLKRFGKSNKQIANEIIEFVSLPNHIYFEGEDRNKLNPEFYGYYADYDWVLFCSLFGRMIDLPKGFPMYCRDLKQMLDEKVMRHALELIDAEINGVYPIPKEHLSPVNKVFDELLKDYKNSAEYPKQENEHNALADAKWNKKLYEFINTI